LSFQEKWSFCNFEFKRLYIKNEKKLDNTIQLTKCVWVSTFTRTTIQINSTKTKSYNKIFYEKTQNCHLTHVWNVTFLYHVLSSLQTTVYSSEAKAGLSGARNSIAKKKQKWTKKKQYDDDAPPILYLSNYSLCCLSFWSFSPSFNLQKLFLMFSTTPIYPKDVLRNFFSNKFFFSKKKSFIFFLFFNFFVFQFFFRNFFLSVSILPLVFASFWQNKQKSL
jgi:hypothetical protein